MVEIKKKTERELQGIDDKLDVLILLFLLQGKDRGEKLKILGNYQGPLSKRELERITGIDRHEF